MRLQSIAATLVCQAAVITETIVTVSFTSAPVLWYNVTVGWEETLPRGTTTCLTPAYVPIKTADNILARYD
jgi:hypothetical protein